MTGAVLESVFEVACQQKCWGHFTKPQRKSISQWKDFAAVSKNSLFLALHSTFSFFICHSLTHLQLSRNFHVDNQRAKCCIVFFSEQNLLAQIRSLSGETVVTQLREPAVKKVKVKSGRPIGFRGHQVQSSLAATYVGYRWLLDTYSA